MSKRNRLIDFMVVLIAIGIVFASILVDISTDMYMTALLTMGVCIILNQHSILGKLK